MAVYADVLFALNAAADYALLLAAARLLGVPVRARRLLCGALCGGLYGVAALVVPVPALFSLPGAAVAAALMAAAAYAPRPPRVFLRLLGCLYGSAALAAGLAMLLSRDGDLPWWGLCAALGGALLAAAALRQRWRPGSALTSLCDLEIEIVGRVARCRGLIDTGNALADPGGDGPAVVVEAPVLAGILPARLLLALAAGPEGLPAAVGTALGEASAAADGPWQRRIRLLPYRTVGQAGGLLCAVRPDRVMVGTGGARRQVRAVLAVSGTPLDPDGAFSALVPAVLVAGDAEPARGWWAR